MVFDFAHNLSNFILLAFDFIQTILVLMFALVEVALIYFDLFIENMGLLISADQLSAQNISFGYDEVVLFLQFPAILFTLFDDLVEFFDLFGLI